MALLGEYGTVRWAGGAGARLVDAPAGMILRRSPSTPPTNTPAHPPTYQTSKSPTATRPTDQPTTRSAVEFNATSSLLEQLLTMRDTGLFVSVHTSNLANAPLLQPGSGVLEFIPVGAGSETLGAMFGSCLDVHAI